MYYMYTHVKGGPGREGEREGVNESVVSTITIKQIPRILLSKSCSLPATILILQQYMIAMYIVCTCQLRACGMLYTQQFMREIHVLRSRGLKQLSELPWWQCTRHVVPPYGDLSDHSLLNHKFLSIWTHLQHLSLSLSLSWAHIIFSCWRYYIHITEPYYSRKLKMLILKISPHKWSIVHEHMCVCVCVRARMH